MLASLDENVGRILRKLDDLKLTDNTIVILTSDNGGVDFSSQRTGNRIPTQNTPFRSGKGTLYEGGIRVPLMIRWPGVSEPVATCDAPVTSQDFFPTFAETLGYVPHELPQHDGVSLLSMLQESPSTLPRKRLFWHYPHYYRRMTPGSAIRQNDWKLIHFYEDERMELYHVKEDAGETNDLSGQLPERVRAMRAALDGWRQSVKAGEPRRNPNWHVSLRP